MISWKIVKSLEESGLLKTSFSQAIKNEKKERKGGFQVMLLDTLGAILLENLLTDKKAIAMRQEREANMTGRGTIRAGEGIIRAGQDF